PPRLDSGCTDAANSIRRRAKYDGGYLNSRENLGCVSQCLGTTTFSPRQFTATTNELISPQKPAGMCQSHKTGLCSSQAAQCPSQAPQTQTAPTAQSQTCQAQTAPTAPSPAAAHGPTSPT